MRSDATSDDSVLGAETVVKIVKKLFFLLFIYCVGYFGLSSLWPCVAVAVIVWDAHRSRTKRQRLAVARAIALGQEKDIILNTIPELPKWVKFPEIDRVEWLNRMFKQIWQQVNEYVEDLVPKILESSIQGYVSDFKFTKVVLGNVPLRVDCVKVYDSEDKRKVELDLDISYAGDCYVTFQTFRFTGGIKDIQLHGRLRVVLTPLISRLPLIGGVQAYFMEPPHVDFDLIKFTQILDIPGIRNRIKSTIMKVINSKFLYPNAYSANLSKGVNMSRLAIFRTEGILRVHVVEGKNLEKKDLFGKSDPYAILNVGSIKVETPVIDKTLNPKWDFWCEFEIEPNSELKVEVWDRDEGSKDDFLGSAKVDISQVVKIGEADMPISLQGVDKGTIHLRLTWLSLSPNYSDLDAAVKESELLSPCLHTSLLMIYLDSSLNLSTVGKRDPSPFVELEVEGQTKKTDAENETCGPIWDKGFTFLLRDPKRAVLHLRIHDERSKTVIGEVSFKVDNLQNEPKMELRGHTFFFNKPHADASICCSMKLRILKNEYVEEKDQDEIAKPQKMVVKQASTASTKSKISQSSVATSDSEHGFADNELNSFLEDETVSNLGQIKLSLSYSQQRQRVVVQVHEVHLYNKNPHTIDPYVRLTLQTDKLKNNKKKTKTAKNSSNPVYNEEFDYLVSSQDLNFTTITLDVKTEKGIFEIGTRFLGQTVISLTKCDTLSQPFTDWFNLKTKRDAYVYHLVK